MTCGELRDLLDEFGDQVPVKIAEQGADLSIINGSEISHIEDEIVTKDCIFIMVQE